MHVFLTVSHEIRINISCFSFKIKCMHIYVFVHSGEIGDWRNHFSDVQSEEMDAAFKKHLEGTKLGARLQYDLHCK
uniref:Sulfotransferase n=1 Tax=Astyanax mexicanus TaxID=7994 RepID=A0A8B9R6K0_ASTMX